jgi:hypothetical protein
MDRCRKAYDRRAHTTLNQCFGSHFRGAGICGRDRRSRIFLCSDTASRRHRHQAGGDEQRPLGAFEHRTDGLDRALVDRAVFYELCEVVDEPGVNDSVGTGRSAAQALEIFERTAMHFRACRGKGGGSRIRASEAKYLVTRIDEFLNDGGADKTSSPGNKDTHSALSHC